MTIAFVVLLLLAIGAAVALGGIRRTAPSPRRRRGGRDATGWQVGSSFPGTHDGDSSEGGFNGGDFGGGGASGDWGGNGNDSSNGGDGGGDGGGGDWPRLTH